MQYLTWLLEGERGHNLSLVKVVHTTWDSNMYSNEWHHEPQDYKIIKCLQIPRYTRNVPCIAARAIIWLIYMCAMFRFHKLASTLRRDNQSCNIASSLDYSILSYSNKGLLWGQLNIFHEQINRHTFS